MIAQKYYMGKNAHLIIKHQILVFTRCVSWQSHRQFWGQHPREPKTFSSSLLLEITGAVSWCLAVISLEQWWSDGDHFRIFPSWQMSSPLVLVERHTVFMIVMCVCCFLASNSKRSNVIILPKGGHYKVSRLPAFGGTFPSCRPWRRTVLHSSWAVHFAALSPVEGNSQGG